MKALFSTPLTKHCQKSFRSQRTNDRRGGSQCSAESLLFVTTYSREIWTCLSNSTLVYITNFMTVMCKQNLTICMPSSVGKIALS